MNICALLLLRRIHVDVELPLFDEKIHLFGRLGKLIVLLGIFSRPKKKHVLLLELLMNLFEQLFEEILFLLQKGDELLFTLGEGLSVEGDPGALFLENFQLNGKIHHRHLVGYPLYRRPGW